MTLSSNRREFMKKVTVVTGTVAASSVTRRVHATENNTINVAVVGCGGRGRGAAVEALSTQGPTKLVATADCFAERADSCAELVADQHPDKVEVPKSRQFGGLDGYKHAIDAVGPGGVVLLATPPAFRPIHLEYAVEKGVHVFMEKSFAVDAPGIRRLLKAGQLASEKNLKVAGGLMSRHANALKAAIEEIHAGRIGDLVSCWTYRLHDALGLFPKRPGDTELAHQIRNYNNYTWLDGSFIVDSMIHNLDLCCWAKKAFPISAQGQGGRQMRKEKDLLFDHYAVEYQFGDGTTLFAQGRHINNCWGFFGIKLYGTKGLAILGERITDPKIYRSWKTGNDNVIWRYTGEFNSFYQTEQDKFFAAIRNDTPLNETERSAHSAMVGILGRMVVESGQKITWDEAIHSNRELAPGLDHLKWDDDAPVMPDTDGHYPIAMPGVTQVL